MKNIHVLPTDKPSRLSIIDSQLIYSKEYYTNPQHIYITSDEEIKEGWHFNNEIGVNKPVYVKDEDVEPLKKIYGNPNHLQKIILTTDSDLIKDGVQAIDDEFLEWFVKNPSCESVEVDLIPYDGTKSISKYWNGEYKIIILKEEGVSSLSGEKGVEGCAGIEKSKQSSVEWLEKVYNKCPAFEEAILEEEWKQAKEMENQQQEEIGLMEIELKHTKTLLASCEKALEDRNKQDKKMYSEEDVRGMLEDMSRYVSTKEMRDNVVDVGYSEWVRKRDWFVNHLIKQFKNK